MEESIYCICMEGYRLFISLQCSVHALHSVTDKVASLFETSLILLVDFLLVGYLCRHQFEKREDGNELDKVLVEGYWGAKAC